MGKIDLIKEAIAKAQRRESKLTPQALMVPSLTSLNIRHLYNNLGSIGTNFCEIGSHLGGSYCSFVYGNDNLETATAIDDFSENFNTSDIKAGFLENASEFTLPPTCWKLLDKDCFTILKEDLQETIDLYLFDGNHSALSQEKALTYMLPFLSGDFIFVVDDYSWEDVKNGTQKGIRECGLEVLFEQEFHTPEGGEPNEHWHNGTYVALLKKTK